MQRNRLERAHQKKLEQICKYRGSGYRGGRFRNIRYENVDFTDILGEWPHQVIPGKHSYLKNTSYAQKLKRYAKWFANRTVRRCGMEDLKNGCYYKKLWNYWKKYDL